jgi:hypothetical protein
MLVDSGDGRTDGDGAYIKESTGAVYIVAGSSAQATGGSLNHPVMHVSLNELGSLVLNIDGDQLDVKFLDDVGLIQDYLTIVKLPDNPAANNIVLDANFDSGSIGPYTINGNVIDLTLQTDQISNNTDDYTYWVNFKLSNVLGQEITLNLTGIDAVPFLAQQGQDRQIVYSCDGETWNRFTQYAYSTANAGTYTINQTFVCDEVQIATFFPFSYVRMQDFIDTVSLSEWATQTLLGSSLQGRDIDLITITNTGIPASTKKHIYIVGRHHAAETSSSHMLEGLINFMISSDPDAEAMRDNFVWHIVPMLNADGVSVGNSRATSELRDPNRDWGNNETDAINIARSHLGSINSSFGVDMFIDWHSQMNDLRWSNFVYSPPGNTFFSHLSQWTDFDEQEAVGSSCSASSCTSRGYATIQLGLLTFVIEPTPHLVTWTKNSLNQEGINTSYAIAEYFGILLPDLDPPTPALVGPDDFEAGFGSWSNVGGDDIHWTRDSGGTPSTGTGPTVDHTTGSSSGFYLYTEASGNGTGFPNMTAVLESPCIDLSGFASSTWTFWYHMVGDSIGTLYAEVAADCGTTWSTELTLPGPQQAAQSSPYLEGTVDLSAYVGTSIQLRFRGVTGTSWSGDMTIDDVRVVATP